MFIVSGRDDFVKRIRKVRFLIIFLFIFLKFVSLLWIVVNMIVKFSIVSCIRLLEDLGVDNCLKLFKVLLVIVWVYNN